jgi:hypothetical protein
MQKNATTRKLSAPFEKGKKCKKMQKMHRAFFPRPVLQVPGFPWRDPVVSSIL